MTLLIASVVLLGIVVLVLTVAVFALARQLGVLAQRIAPAAALPGAQQLKASDAAPEIALQSLDGRTLSTHPSTGKSNLLFFLSPDCPICKSLLPVLKRISAEREATQIILISEGENEDAHQSFVASADLSGLDYVVSEIAARSFNVTQLPFAAMIDSNAQIQALGLVNSEAELINIVSGESAGISSITTESAAANQTQSNLFHQAKQ